MRPESGPVFAIPPAFPFKLPATQGDFQVFCGYTGELLSFAIEETEVATDVRILSATHKNLEQLVHCGAFRQDLFYRLNVIALRLPSLHEHAEDIPELAAVILQRLSVNSGLQQAQLTPEALLALQTYPFPGNIRELENIVQRTVIMAKGETIEAGDLPQDLRGDAPLLVKHEGPELVTLETLERRHIRDVLAACDGNKTRAAEILGIDRVSLWRKVKRLGLAVE